jgi:hypothetical protein
MVLNVKNEESAAPSVAKDRAAFQKDKPFFAVEA